MIEMPKVDRERPAPSWWWPIAAGAILSITGVVAAQGEVVAGEAGLFQAVNELPDAAEALVKAVMRLGTLPGVLVVAVVLAVATRDLLASGAVALAAVLTRLVNPELKDLVARPRPAGLLTGIDLRQAAASTGFPSGHTAAAVAAALAVAWWFPRLRWPALAVAAVVSVGRMYVGVHLPLDLVGGAAVGVLAAWLATGAARMVAGRANPE